MNNLAALLQRRNELSPEDQNALDSILSSSNIYGNGDNAIAQAPDNQLASLLKPPEMNTMRNNSTGASYSFNQQPQQPALDYAQPIEVGGSGKGYRVKGDPFSVMLADGTRVSLGQDVGATRQRQKEDIGLKMAEANLEGQNIQNQTARSGMKAAPAGYRYTADGNMERIPGGPADLKAEELAKNKAAGAGDVDLAIGTLRDAYDRLEKGGGITSTANSSIENVPAYLASSGGGQGLGKMFGTDNQSARNDIAMTRPALLAAIMKSSGMSAKQMDSNVELKLWLATATDPTLDVESNRRALAKIEKKYLGGNVQPQNNAAPSAPAGWKIERVP